MMGFLKLVRRIFPENESSRALHRACGFCEVGGGYRAQILLGERGVPISPKIQVAIKPLLTPAPAVAEALVATASGDNNSKRAALVSTSREARQSLQQILEWIEKQPFDPEDLA